MDVRWRGAWRVAVAAVLAVVALVVVADPASAHASQIGSDPAPGAALDVAPGRIVVRFDAPVSVAIGGIRLLDGQGGSLDVGATHTEGADVVAESPGLGEGAYVVAWSVISADGHPIRGAFTFTVGDVAGVAPGILEQVLDASGADRSVGVAAAAVRALLFGSLAVGLGVLVVLGAAPPWLTSPRRRWRSLVVAAAVGAVVASFASVALQGADAAGGSLRDALRWSLSRHVLETRFGKAASVRAIVLLALVPLATAAAVEPGATRTRRWRLTAAAVVVAVAGSVAVAGHASTGRVPGLGLLADVAHISAMAVWLGALVALAAAWGVASRDERPVLARRVSALAAGAVAVLVVSGVVQSWRQVGSWDGLTSTAYGRLLLVKVGVVVAMLGLGGLHRWQIARRGTPASLRRSLVVELVAGVGVVGITALLVQAVPPVDQVGQPYFATARDGTTLVELAVDPITAGEPTAIHLYLSPTGGALARVADVEVTGSLPDRDLGPIDLVLDEAGPNHYADYDFTLPLAGDWVIEVTGRLGEFDTVNARFSLRVR